MSEPSIGYLTELGRRSALQTALPLAGSYFKRSGELGSASDGLDTETSDVPPAEDLIRAIRLRVAIQAASMLTAAAAKINRQPTFRYVRRQLTSRGEVRGALDLARLSRGGPRAGSPDIPVVVVERAHGLPENLSLCAALLLVHRELDLARELVTRKLKNGPEFIAAARLSEQVERALKRPWLVDIREDSIHALRRGTIRGIVEAADRRVVAGHTSSPTYYAKVISWILKFLEGVPTQVAGDIDWSYYGHDFDETLFEIWCLEQLRHRVVEAFGGEESTWIYGREQPVISTAGQSGDAELSLFTQMSPSRTIDRTPSWRSSRSSLGNDRKRLQGIPDYTLVGGDGGFIFLDAKLRDRARRPTEEIYKMLGYFNNFVQGESMLGAIIYYAKPPRETAYEVFENDAGGQVVVFSVDPERPAASDSGWSELISLLSAVVVV